MSSSTTTNPRSTNMPPKNETKKKKEAFKGDVEGMGGAVLQLPNERQRGSPAQFEKFTNALLYYVGREVGEGTARLWAVEYIRKGLDSPGTTWSPPLPKKPDNKKDDGQALLYELQREAYKDAIGADWPAAKLEIWSTILGQCSCSICHTVNYRYALNRAFRVILFDYSDNVTSCMRHDHVSQLT